MFHVERFFHFVLLDGSKIVNRKSAINNRQFLSVFPVFSMY